ncbi:MAG: hypothetical protein QM619_15000 [Micropruina sp.]|uniref:FitA-like ribbon-helix-helix domain-containing protein n=1 Tax=Micropruina sp. TaxID=2737536 RepID=UPI0039E66C08
MAQLIVRNLDDDLVGRLKRRAADHGRSAEEEHRQILRAALRPGSLLDRLQEFPAVGEDADFEPVRDAQRELSW